MNLALEPLVNRRTGFTPVIRYSCLHSHSRAVHNGSPPCFTPHTTLPYPPTHLQTHHNTTRPQGPNDIRSLGLTCECHSFGGVLEPRYIVGAESLDQ
jgi:hypothetical protein